MGCTIRTLTAAAALILALPLAARADEGEAPSRFHEKASARRETPIVGLQLTAGAPEGAGLALVLRPLSFLRFELGGSTNLAAPGVHGGLVLCVPWYVSPVIAAEVGYQFPGDFNQLANLAGLKTDANPLLAHVSYTWANLHAGLELGAPNRFMVTFHAGYSAVRSDTSGLGAYLATQQTSLNLRTTQEGHVRLVAPSARVGLLFYVF